MPILRTALLMVVLVVLGACGGESERPWLVGSASCTEQIQGQRASGFRQFEETARIGTGEDYWFGQVSGIYVSAESVFLLDLNRKRVFEFSHSLAFKKEFGREGRGPGEFPGEGILPRPRVDGGRPRWITGSDSAILIFDGSRVQEFGHDGEFRSRLSPAPVRDGLNPLFGRVSSVRGFLAYGRGGAILRRVRTTHPAFQVVVAGAPPRRDTIGVALPDLPLYRGVPYSGVDQALPVWDVWGECIVLSDGHSPWLAVGGVGAVSPIDTIVIQLPQRAPRRRDREAVRGLIGLVTGSPRGPAPPPPSATRNVRDLVVDPHGVVWILPGQPRDRIVEGVEVYRVPLAGGAIEVDTVPIFPQAFAPDGTYFATWMDSLGRVLLGHFRGVAE